MLAPAVWTGPAALAQDDEDLEDAIAELTEIVAELEEDVDDLSDEVETLREEVERLGVEVDDLKARGTSPPPGEEGVERLLGLWVETSSTASADCGSITCAYKYDWRDLELWEDGTYRWGETPYEEGDYEVHERGESEAFDVANFDVLLQGEGDLECLVSYDSYYDTMNIYLSRCPRVFAEPSEGGEPQELTLGFISFAPGY